MQNKVKSLSEVKIGSIVVLNNGNKYIFLGKGNECVYNVSLVEPKYVGANIGNKITDTTTYLSIAIFKELKPHDTSDWAIRFIYGSLGELIYDTNARREEKVMSIADAEKRLSELLNADVKICDECVNNEVEDIKKMAEVCMDYCDQLVSCSECPINNHRDINCEFVDENDIRKAYKIINE